MYIKKNLNRLEVYNFNLKIHFKKKKLHLLSKNALQTLILGKIPLPLKKEKDFIGSIVFFFSFFGLVMCHEPQT